MRIGIWLIFAVVLPLSAAAQTPTLGCGNFTVPPESEALVFGKDGGIKRKVRPGRHTCVPFFETVLIEKTVPERREDIVSSRSIDGCKATVSVIWRISDLETYHIEGSETAAVAKIQDLIQETLGLPEAAMIDRENVSSHMQSALRERNQEFEQMGVDYIRSFVRLENCAQE